MAETMGGGWKNPDYGFDPKGLLGGFGGLLGGIFGDSGKPYDDAKEEYEKYMNKVEGIQEPYQNAGKEGLKNYQDWLNGQKNPTEFINKLMGDYNESPYAHYLQQQATNSGMNFGSASGLTGSSALMQQMQQNAGGIASKDMNQWLQNVLGINTQYGQGEKNLVDTGQNSTNKLTDMYNTTGQRVGEAAYGKEAGKKSDFWNTLSGIGNIIGSFF